MTAYYRSPSSGSAAAATTPARFAQEYDDVRWRDLPEGGIEVAVRDGNRVERLRVDNDGGIRHIHTSTLPSIRGATALIQIGLSLFAGSFALMFITAGGVGFVPAFTGILLAMLGAIRSWPVTLHWHSDLGSGWHEPTDLKSWMPRSSAQLAVVESIANRRGGQAWVRDGADSVMVRARRGFGFDYYVVEDDGFMIQQASERSTTRSLGRSGWIEIRTFVSDD